MIKGIVLHNNFIKIVSLIFGYLIWAFIAQYQTITINQPVPICFYQTQDNITILGPDSVNISLSGKRKHLYLFETENSAIHIDASQFNKPGKHLINLSKESLFLPDNIFLEELKPSTIVIEITSKDKSNDNATS